MFMKETKPLLFPVLRVLVFNLVAVQSVCHLPMGITHFIELAVEREKRCIRTCSFHAEDAIDDIDVPFRKERQGSDEFFPIVICNALVVKDVDQALRRPVLWHLIDLCEDVNALGDHALKNNGPRAPFFDLVKEFLCSGVKGFVISREISDEVFVSGRLLTGFLMHRLFPCSIFHLLYGNISVGRFRRIR